ncbi:DinB family protein [Fimbriimonas ginsengisoli]|uniref:DinB-like domain-containing protein n=1 Tax=Fimbriimonas ginsengisoli Gsoil 348 TaxID=661478 RepID=A0A068NUK7_FIMGI|nr:DinB family protein [Fimbriimonas ginsengisoli]AIE87218.1 hypothetical protein OP10G_3850 [Fimbriimonas ginsengisoli Gsoil 348]
MLREDWNALFESLEKTRDIVSGWEAMPPDEKATRCEHSRHRTLAHLRACQEQWMVVVDEFLSRNNPNVTILHPWRKFDQGGYGEIPWEEHLTRFLADRDRWLAWKDSVDWNRGGKMNRKPDTVGGLTQRLANHEAYHINLFG